MSRILFTTMNWYGSNSRSCSESLRRLGCEVLDVDEESFIPHATLFTSKVVRRLLWPRFVSEFNRAILQGADNLRPDIFLAFKGNYIYSETLRSLRQRGVTLYNYFPDTSAFNHGKWLPQSLPEYDCVFYTKPFWLADTRKRIKLRDGVFLPHGYSPHLHCPIHLEPRDIADYECDVSFIANHSLYKEHLLAALISSSPHLDLRIWGWGWRERSRSAALCKCIKGFPLLGESYAKAIQASRINLSIMNGPITGATSGDLTTSRTYTIPASGGFMLHERNAEVLELYKEDEEIACFDSPEELAAKIDYFLAHPEARHSIARAGHARCVPAYSYDNRMAEVLRWHIEHAHISDLPVPISGLAGC
jgi:spore maturation protein CgeB